jgi:hypothetical protein
MPKAKSDNFNPTLSFSDANIKRSLQAQGVGVASFMREALLFWMAVHNVPLVDTPNVQNMLPDEVRQYILTNYESSGRGKGSNAKDVIQHIKDTWGVDVSVSRLGKVVARGRK